MQQDSFIPNIKRFTISAPFPHTSSPVLQFLRRLLRRWLKQRPITIILQEMTLDAFFLYMQLFFGVVEKVSKKEQGAEGNPQQQIQNAVMRSFRIAQECPELFCIATGINDPEFFQSLPPSSLRAIEEAIEEVNPAKKNISDLLRAYVRDQEIRNGRG